MNDKVRAARNKEIREWIQLALIVFTIGWTSYEFFFKEFIKPAQEPTALELDATLERAGEKDGFILIKGNIQARNLSNKRIYVPAFWYTIKARQLSTKGPAQTPTPDTVDMLQDKIISKYAPAEVHEIVAQQRLAFTGESWWDPKDKTNHEFIFAIPANKFDFLDMKVVYIFTKDNHELAEPEWIQLPDGSLWAKFGFKEQKSDEETLEWLLDTSGGFNWSTVILSLREKPKN